PGRFSGQLSGAALDHARAAFAFGEEAPLSAHQLEDHATCAFRTLGKRLLHIEVDDRDDAELGARERGTLLHRCLEKFFRRIGDVHVRGIVDRIDRLPDGTLLVLDYKSGRLTTLSPRVKAEALLAPEFQLVLYAEMVRQRYPSARVDAAYVSLRDARRTATLRDNGIDPAALPLAAAVQDRVS